MNIEEVRSLATCAKKLEGRNLNEAQTKTALVQPFIEAMGYKVSDPFEVIAEFTADQGIKRGEKIDYAIMKDDTPIILIECKPLGKALDTGCCNQLRRYFQSVPEAKIAILTDGIRYLFFSDRKKVNLMDDRPFMEIDFCSFNEQLLPELQRLCKASFDMDGILNSADSLQAFREMMCAFSAEMEEPTGDFVKFFAAKIHKGRISARVLENYSRIFCQVVEGYLDERLNRRLDDSKKALKAVHIESNKEDNGIVTVNTEIWGFVIVRTLLHQIVEPGRIFMRDQRSYCPIILDDNNRKTICRFYNFCEWDEDDPNIGENAYILIFSEPQGVRFPLRSVDDIYPLKEYLVTAVKHLL